jgi:hypothetical protein
MCTWQYEMETFYNILLFALFATNISIRHYCLRTFHIYLIFLMLDMQDVSNFLFFFNKRIF